MTSNHEWAAIAALTVLLIIGVSLVVGTVLA
jgi:hypothetical protein